MNDLPDDLMGLVAERFRLLGDGTRLRIIRFLLARGEAPVGEIAAATGCSQANVSKHLRLLHDARVVRRRAEGTMAFYRVVDPSVEELCDIVCGGIRRQVAEEAALVGLTPGGQQ
ncbi:ArsR/SmtB family transcription factor [Tepidiforma bonchosmolovskayae]|uniref:Helix-turn-helix transcriptional regulator n=1 Tax=Tepidiforma bonchosmolovskayae TaxID=2601677 RepID=A0ABX6C0D4_9CHLR|nr:metalloregulator ArsR/SmtB family transcription factor [Tepidiforma bonchosmolovskayae]QFG02561.1 helix-turn-helix transcriptional regulator [Tepidiforma bonchosmolovskayae]